MIPEDFDNSDEDFDLEMERIARDLQSPYDGDEDGVYEEDNYDTNISLEELYGDFPSEVSYD